MKLAVLLLFLCNSLTLSGQTGFSLRDKPADKKIEVWYDNTFITAYCYFDSTEKPVLFPIKTLSGVTITRGYPIAPRDGESTDHPHHVGLWLTYESVNGLDFWNNSFAIPAEKKSLYGSIRHEAVLFSKARKDMAVLKTLSHWVDPSGNVLLDETTEFVFRVMRGSLVIDRIGTLTAKVHEVVFKDVKDGFLGLRVAKELEMPSKKEANYVDAHGNRTTVTGTGEGVATGMYVNREGIFGDDTWGKRSRWTALNGEKDGEHITVAMIDHPQNPGAPTYWHARGYGLFAANPLGQKVFSNGKEELNYRLPQGQSVTFQFRVVIHSGQTALTAGDEDYFMNDFSEKK